MLGLFCARNTCIELVRWFHHDGLESRGGGTRSAGRARDFLRYGPNHLVQRSNSSRGSVRPGSLISAKMVSRDWQIDSTLLRLTARAAPFRLCESRKTVSDNLCLSLADRSVFEFYKP